MVRKKSQPRPNLATRTLKLLHHSSIFSVISVAFFLLLFQANSVWISIGPFSLSVYATVLVAGLVSISLLTQVLQGRYIQSGLPWWRLNAPSARMLRIMWPLILLLLFSAARLAFKWRIEGAQNLLALTILVIGILALATETNSHKVKSFLSFYLYVSLAVSVVFVAFTVVGLQGFANRQYGMIMLVGLSIAVVWPTANRLLQVAPFFLTFSIALSQSRTTALVAIILLAAHIFLILEGKGKQWSRVLVSMGVAAGVAVLAFLSLSWLQAWLGRDLEERALLETSGRFAAWGEFLTLLTKPTEWLFGLGTGAAMQYGTAYIPYFPHPHNEYLRFLVDLGILGLVLLLLGAISLLIQLGRSWPQGEPVTKAALLVVISLGIVATTDGALYSSFVIIPATLVVGLGLASTLAPKSLSHEQSALRSP